MTLPPHIAMHILLQITSHITPQIAPAPITHLCIRASITGFSLISPQGT